MIKVITKLGSCQLPWQSVALSLGSLRYKGDLIGSGTCGTGCILELGPENTGGWLKPGDTIDTEIERLGVLTTPIV